ncbi:hypothetical protein KL928_003820 [Ogataea angusta]|uniref:Major facilitator superfamily (MFS) profile domain-containing protein n=1 Tax=Pichia angusta TaxID=870730 RepID=A0AAN6DEC8_PICAN|nr:uncharacterized protein KL928_003820 [Ogataea angusta]KAG7817921.1 hypothetical protein KL928_003820 [Ogataea angusta]
MLEETPLLQDPSGGSAAIVARELAKDIEGDNTDESSLASFGQYGAVELQKPAGGISPSHLRIILCCLFVNVFLSSLDATIVATLLSVISSDLNELTNSSWLATSYLLACAAFQPLFGKISDIFGRRSITIICTVLFGFGCLLCGITSSFWVLVFGRFITGIGGGGFNTLSTITLSDVIPTRQRGLYQGYMNIAFGFGTASGGVVAGFFHHYFGWRSAFLVQVPICILSAVLVLFFLELPKGSPGRGLEGHGVWKKVKTMDFAGSLLLVASLLLLMYAASSGGKEFAYSSLEFKALLASGTIFMTLFYFYELKVAAEPVIPVQLLANKTVLSSSLNCWFTSMNVFSIIYYVPFYWLSVKNMSSMESGIRLLPAAVAISVGSLYAGYRIKKTGKYRVAMHIYGLLAILGSMLVYILKPESSSFFEYAVLIPSRLGTGAVITVDLIAMISSVTTKEQALVTSIQYGFRSTGSTIGVSIASAILQGFLSRNLRANFSNLSNVPPEFNSPEKLAQIIDKALHSTIYAHTKCPKFARNAVISAYDSSCHAVFIYIVMTAIAATASTWFIEENSLENK